MTAGGTVHIANGIYKGTNNRCITINRNMTIIGQSQTGTIIDAENQNRIFIINSGVTVTLQNMTLKNGRTGDNPGGGAILNNGNLIVINSTFTGNTAFNFGEGGAIFNNGNLTVRESAFIGNGINSYEAAGGAISSGSGNLTVTGSTFTDNFSYGSESTSGAIWVLYTTAEIHFNKFLGNKSSYYNNTLGAFNSSANADYNWWGSNNPDLGPGVVYGIDVNPWIVLNVTADPTFTNVAGISQVTADLLHDSGILSDPTHPELYYHNPADGHVPDGIQADFSFQGAPLGTLNINPAYTENGATTTTFTANSLGTSHVLATVDSGTAGPADIQIIRITKLVFNKTVNSGTHYFGDTIHYYLKVENTGPDDADNVSVFDQLPSGLIFKSANSTLGSYKLNTGIWTIGKLMSGHTATLDIKTLVNKIGKITNTATLNYTTQPAAPITKNVSFIVPRAVTIPQLIIASGQIKAYAESHNYKLPKNLQVAGQTLTMPQMLRLLVIATIHINQKNYNPISVTDVAKAPYPDGYTTYGNIYTKQYLTTAIYINSFIKNNGRAPNYAQTSLGNIYFTRLVYMYTKMVKFYGNNHRLPNYVYTYRIN